MQARREGKADSDALDQAAALIDAALDVLPLTFSAPLTLDSGIGMPPRQVVGRTPSGYFSWFHQQETE